MKRGGILVDVFSFIFEKEKLFMAYNMAIAKKALGNDYKKIFKNIGGEV